MDYDNPFWDGEEDEDNDWEDDWEEPYCLCGFPCDECPPDCEECDCDDQLSTSFEF